MVQRNERIRDDKNLDISMDPQVYQAFMASTAVT